MVNMILIGGVAAAIFVLSGIRIIRPTHRGAVETLGKFTQLTDAGFHWIFPIIQKMPFVNITEQMVDVEPQTVITKDKLNAEVDAVVYYKVKDVKAALYNVDDHKSQLTALARTTLRSVIGKMTLTEANENRDDINASVEKILDAETKDYGVDVLRVEIQKIEPPRDVQESMNKVVKAEQEKIAAKDTATALETKANGERRAAIQVAEGQKQASILKAEGEAKAFDLINKSFTGNAQLLKKLEVTQASLQNNAKIVLTEKGISPQIILGDIPVKER